MNRTDQMNGNAVAKEAKEMASKNYDAAAKVGAKLEKSAESFADQVSDRAIEVSQEATKMAREYTQEAGKMAKEYSEILADYTKRHPWRVGLTFAAVGAVAAAFLLRKK